ncbi:MAG: glucose-6-phosphate isomerase [Deltaproteobacteria bacterium]|nr:glucose-6-phosphate isomerase [Deltaproteobacteria bacterium]
MLRDNLRIQLGDYRPLLDDAFAELRDENVVERIYDGDHRLWKSTPEEVADRLGWVESPRAMLNEAKRFQRFTDSVLEEGFTHALLLGMGGSSLAPHVVSSILGCRSGYVNLDVLDSTDPAMVLSHSRRLEPAKTLFLVSTKSGTTVETVSLFKYFYNWLSSSVGKERTGRHFVAITDPASPLEEKARRYGFRDIFLNDPAIGGRYSALSCFGLVPASLIGADIRFILNRALQERNFRRGDPEFSTGIVLGALLGALARAGRDKMTLVTSPQIASFGDWVEQLIAESTGKEGKGILPVVGEQIGDPDVYGTDRLFIYLCLEWDRNREDERMSQLSEAGHPVIYLYLKDLYDVGRQFFLWELATAVAGYFLRVNPFDQPDVEAAKVRTREIIDGRRKKGRPASDGPDFSAGGVSVFGYGGDDPAAILSEFLDGAADGAYVSLHAYVKQTPEMDSALAGLRAKIRDTRRVATTVGYGPRFLHSTGQLHKGDGGAGLFVQITAEDLLDVPIPDEAGLSSSSTTFGVLKAAQAEGDRKVLADRGRQVIRFHFQEDVPGGIEALAASL